MDVIEETAEHTSPSSYWRMTLVFGIGLLIAVSSFGAGILAERDLIQGSASSNSNDEFDQLTAVKDLIDEEYYGAPEESEPESEFEQTLEYGAIQGMMSTLDDYSTFLIPAEQTAVREQMSGEYQGIGVWVDFPDGRLTIVSPMPGSPAEEAGLQAGDVILAVDGNTLGVTNADDALVLVRGPEGSTVRLTIQRDGVADPFDVNVERRRIPVQSVTYEYLEESGIGLIRVSVFGDNTTAELDAALKQAQADGVNGIVLDLRNNGGGWVTSAQEMIGRFVPDSSGPALFEDFDPDGSERAPQPILTGEVAMYDVPLVVLVNQGTASASEIVAGALRDYDRARIVGETTFGKGSVQKVHDFQDGSSARITFAEWLTPHEHRIQGEGIQPDVIVPAAESGDTSDPQLATAVEMLMQATGDEGESSDQESTPIASPDAQSATPVASPDPDHVT